MEYRIFTDATADMNQALLPGYPELGVIPMEVELGGQRWLYGPGGNITIPRFYSLQRDGQFASTSQAPPQSCLEAFEPALRLGQDILYLGFSSAMSGCVQSVHICMEELRLKYPSRKLICLDTLCASVGEGFLIREALARQAAGASIHELAEWIVKRRLSVCHWFTVDTLDHLQRGGRISAVSASVGGMLKVKPLLHVDENGVLKVAAKPRGRKRAMEILVKRMEDGWRPDFGKLTVIGHGDCWEEANTLRGLVSGKFPQAEIVISEIGPIIGAHTGPGMLALIYWGDNR